MFLQIQGIKKSFGVGDSRVENRKKYLEKGERQKRTHRLCNLGGTIESLVPEVKDLTRTEKIGRASCRERV